MSYIWCIFLLLTVVPVVEKSFVSGSNCNTCAKANNNYEHNPDLASELDGYLYVLYLSSGMSKNEINNFEHIGNHSIRVRTTDDGKCCKTVNFELGEEYNTFDIESDEDCSTKLSEGSGRQKLLVSNKANDGTCCIILWGCRKSRESVYTLCDKRKVSRMQKKWIREEYDWMNLTAIEVKQTIDYKDGKCFEN